MTETELERLKDLPVPSPRSDAKAAAEAAALAAFDAEMSATTTQGDADQPRLTPRPHRAARRKLMTMTRSQLAMAASLVALIAAAPLAFRMTQPGVDDLVRSVESGPAALPPAAPGTGRAEIASNEMRGQSAQGPKEEKDKLAKRLPVDEWRRDADGGEAAGLTAPTKDQPLSASASPPKTDQLGYAAPPPSPAPAGPLGAQGLNNFPAGLPVVGELSAHDSRVRTLVVPPEQSQVARLEDQAPPAFEQEFRDKFTAKEINPVKQVAAEPVATFSIDVDTASYGFVRRMLNAGHLPPKDAVRVEEMVNYFPYAYPKPETAEVPFKPTVTVMPAPWNPSNRLVHIAIKGYDIASTERPRANLVFLIDVSGSMTSEDKLPLVRNAFKLLVNELKPDDTIGIVTYASGSGVALEPTKASEKSKIIAAIDRLGAGGSTAGAEGIEDAYRLAEANFDKAAVNRVILATDGDFNVGVTDQDALKGLIERKRDKGIFLSILGVGQGNYNDSLMQTLAQNGNGTAAYVDTLNEARKVLVDESSSTLFPIAKDVKIQIEWNPSRVAEYRLIGYETRALAREDFNNDKVDAGDIGSGHTVTAIYEVTPVGAPQMVDALRYAKPEKTASAAPQPTTAGEAKDDELGFLKLRYKLPKEETSRLISLPIAAGAAEASVDAAPQETRFSVAVAAFGQLIKGAPYLKGYGYDDVIALAQSAKGDDPYGYRAEFINLVRLAKSAQP